MYGFLPPPNRLNTPQKPLLSASLLERLIGYGGATNEINWDRSRLRDIPSRSDQCSSPSVFHDTPERTNAVIAKMRNVSHPAVSNVRSAFNTREGDNCVSLGS